MQEPVGISQWSGMHRALISPRLPAVGQEEGLCSPLCLPSQRPCLKKPKRNLEACAKPSLQLFFSLPTRILAQMHTVPITSLVATRHPVTRPCQLRGDGHTQGIMCYCQAT